MHPNPVALVTGGAQRIGAAITRHLHARGYDLLIHYRRSRDEAEALARELNHVRADSARCLGADLLQDAAIAQLAEESLCAWQRLDLLVNNASSFYPTPLSQISAEDWHDLLGSNARAPLFLCRNLAPALCHQGGTIVNLIDVHARNGLAEYTPYIMAKAALAAMTRCLARELAPSVRVNGVAPGAILWPTDKAAMGEEEKQKILDQICLGRLGTPEDIAALVGFLAQDAHYVTGQVIAVDGGRSLNL